MIEKEGLEIPLNVKENLMILSPHFVISRYPDASNGIPARQYNKNIAEDLECGQQFRSFEIWLKFP
jgi:HEPN domain-containing protein